MNLILQLALVASVSLLQGEAFVVRPASHQTPVLSQATTATTLASASSPYEDDEEREFARVRRRGGRRREQDDEYLDDTESSFDKDRRSRPRDDAVYDTDDYVDYDRLDDLLDDDDDYIYDEQEYDLLSNVLIPNRLLDSMDPDGAAERFPELASDPRFWFDMVLFVAFLNFLSFVGPQDPFPDIPWY